MNNISYVPRRKVLETLGIHYNTLYNMVDRNEIETIKVGRNSVYNLNKYIKDNNISIKQKRKICYCRVSSQKQKEDLERQIDYMRNKYPNYEIISDIASGLNFKRKGLLEIINSAINGDIDEVVIAYKDRLARFGYELIETILKEHSNAIIKIINKSEEKTASEELTEDIISIMNIYVAKINGLRKYKKQLTDTIEEECKNCEKLEI
jgi:predicted site-specific integrase-resolvase